MNTAKPTLLCYADGKNYQIECANAFVARVVSAVFDSENFGCEADAVRTAEILNKHFATEGVTA